MKSILTVCLAIVLCVTLVGSASAQACCGAKEKVKNASEKVASVADKSIKDVKKDIVPVILCGKCGEVKGSDKCCVKGAIKCKKCGLDKGAPGCCKMGDTGGNMVQCPKTGKLMACPLKSSDCSVKDLKKACAAGGIKGCPLK